MKKLFISLSLILGLFLSQPIFADSPTVVPGITVDMALTMAKAEFPGQNYDYYLIEDDSEDIWSILVDTQPKIYWDHDYWIVTFSKKILANLDTTKPLGKFLRTTPPNEELTPLETQNLITPEFNNPILIEKTDLTEDRKNIGRRIYALIISGGKSINDNRYYFWFDCSNIYKVLTRVYGVPKGNIYPIMADGTNKGKDHKDFQGFSRNQSLDLDNDGEDEIKLSATRSNIQNSLNSIYPRINKDDMLFVFVTDHGGKEGNNISYIDLWDKKKLYDSELAAMLEPFTNKSVIVNVVLGQCYSGGFIDDLKKIGCVVTTASLPYEPAWFLGGYNSEFLYHWTEAINLNSPEAKNADKDGNGRVTMQEAFEYAVAHMRNDPNDPQQVQNPQFCSTPTSLGDDLSFDYLPSSIDLYIKDNIEDTGKEPNMSTEISFESPSIWVRNQKDGIEKHENPIFSNSHKKAYIYVKIDNRGRENYSSGQWLHVYCSKASTGLTKAAWKGSEIYSEDGKPTGMHLTPIQIPTISTGQSRTMAVEWNLPDELLEGAEANSTEKHHFCILTRIVPDANDDFEVTGSFDVLASNDMAQKNVSIISYKDLATKTKIFVRNLKDGFNNYSLELRPRTPLDESIFKQASIELGMSYTLYTSWQAGGSKTTDIAQPSDAIWNEECPEAETVFSISSPTNSINSICMAEAQVSPVTLRFDFHTPPVLSKNYTLDLIQRDESGKIVGGETFYIETPEPVAVPIDTLIEIDPIPYPGGITLSSKAATDNKSTWFDHNNKKVGENKTLNISKAKEGETYKLTALNKDGELKMAKIVLENISAIKNFSVDATGNNLEIEFSAPVVTNSEINITSIIEGRMKIKQNLMTGENKVTINISSLAEGSYTATYILNNQAIESIKFKK